MPYDPLYTDPSIISASTGQLFETVEGLLGRTLSDSERLSFTTRLAGINTTLVAPGDLITADLFNTLRADINDLSLRLAKLEEIKKTPPSPIEKAGKEAARILRSKKEALTKGGFQAIILKYPSIVAPGGQADTIEKKAAYIRVLDLYLNALIESIEVEDGAKLDEVLLQIKETNEALGFSNKLNLEFYLYIMNNNGIAAGPAFDVANQFFSQAVAKFS